ncbi:MAG: NADH-quinone oxidoreductase subunit C [Elusimicrobiota bacterium]
MSELIKEEELKKEIENKFAGSFYDLNISRKNRIWIGVNADKALEFMSFLKDRGYKHLSTITGFDEGENLGAIYHITDYHILVNVKIRTPKNSPSLKTVRDIYPVCESFERELEDLFGIKIEGLPEGRNYPLPEGFPKGVHPLRKEVKLDELVKTLDSKEEK